MSRLKIVFLWITSLPAFVQHVLSAEEPVDQPAKSKKYNLSVCSLFKNEAKFLKEWIEFHRLVGVDHFYLYNNGSTDHYQPVLAPYLKEGLVTLVQWPDLIREQSEETAFKWALSTQVTAYENAAKFFAIRESKWLTVLDVGEFLVPAQETNLAGMLEKLDEYPGVMLVSDFYDSAAVNVFPKRKLLIETVELTNAPKQNIQKAVEKMIFKPEECVSFAWPPFKYNFRNKKEAIKINRKTLRINHYTNRKKIPWQFASPKEKIHVDNRLFSEEETNYWLEAGYEMEDQERSIQRFLPDLLIKIGYDPIKTW